MSLSKELQERGFVNQFTGDSLSEIIDGKKRVVYHGIDPTADSAHAGNFVNWMLLSHLAKAGHKVIFLVGGGTGMIGDPKNDVERPTSDPEEVANNVFKLKKQAEKIFSGIKIDFVNNADWLTTLNLIDFLRDTGKRFTINELIKKDAIATRLAGENGISYTEFAYPLLQAYDYLTLQRLYGCDLQVGGSDQWGNIVSGVDLIRRVESKTVYALTVPLIVDKTTGKKFGKSEGNAIWLDSEKTSPYVFYQFWLNTTDDNVIDYLKLFTFLTLEEIDEINKDFEVNPGNRSAQKKLAFEITKIVHGDESAISSANVSSLLFGGEGITTFSEVDKKLLFSVAPTHQTEKNKNIIDVVVESELAKSKREARTFVESGAITLNGEKIESIEYSLSESDFPNDFALLKRGQKQLRVIQIK